MMMRRLPLSRRVQGEVQGRGKKMKEGNLWLVMWLGGSVGKRQDMAKLPSRCTGQTYIMVDSQHPRREQY